MFLKYKLSIQKPSASLSNNLDEALCIGSSNLKTLPLWEGWFSNEGTWYFEKSILESKKNVRFGKIFLIFGMKKKFSNQLQINSEKTKLTIFILWLVCSYSFPNIIYQTKSRINSYLWIIFEVGLSYQTCQK